jgi:hypothetical protein
MMLRLLDGSKTRTRRKFQIGAEPPFVCQYGNIGDRLWTREIFSRDLVDPQRIIYRCDPDANRAINPVWTSPIFMPKNASRVKLEITGLKHEPLQSITPAAAIAEGILVTHSGGELGYRGTAKLPERAEPIAAFRDLWDSIAKPRFQWVHNPRVWEVCFRRVD